MKSDRTEIAGVSTEMSCVSTEINFVDTEIARIGAEIDFVSKEINFSSKEIALVLPVIDSCSYKNSLHPQPKTHNLKPKTLNPKPITPFLQTNYLSSLPKHLI